MIVAQGACEYCRGSGVGPGSVTDPATGEPEPVPCFACDGLGSLDCEPFDEFTGPMEDYQ